MFSISARTVSSLVKMVGMTTNVRAVSGVPDAVFILGSGFGLKRIVTSRFNALNTKSLIGTINSRLIAINDGGEPPETKAYKMKGARKRPVITANVPRYALVGCLSTPLKTRSIQPAR